jgi:hypothetical protein
MHQPASQGDVTENTSELAGSHLAETGNPGALWLSGAARQYQSRHARKAELLAAATRDFCEIGRPSLEDLARFKELFYQFISVCDKGARRMLAFSLSKNLYTPRSILIYLAMDELDVATPVLLFGDAINEADIINLASRLSVDHLKILARRQDLSPAAINALCKFGGQECADIIALTRPKMPGIPASARLSRSTMPILNGAHTVNNTTRELISLAERGGKLGRSGQTDMQDTKANQGEVLPFERKLLLAMRSGGAENAASLIEAYCNIPRATMLRLFEHGDNDALCVVFRGLDAGFVTALQLLLLLKRDITRDKSQYSRVKNLFHKLEYVKCRNFLKELGAQFDDEKTQKDRSRAAAARPLPAQWPDLLASRRRELVHGEKPPPKNKKSA